MKTKTIHLTPRIKPPKFANKNIGPVARHVLMTEPQRWYQTCIHEAAHAVFTYCLNGALQSDGCSVSSSDEGVAKTELYSMEPADEAVMIMAGPTAELVWLAHPSRFTRANFRWWYENHYQRTPGMRRTDACDQLAIAKELRPDDIYGIMGEWDLKVNRMLKDPVIWTAIIGVANRLYAQKELEGEAVERSIIRIVKQMQATGFPEPTKHNQLLYELRNNFKKFIHERRDQRPY